MENQVKGIDDSVQKLPGRGEFYDATNGYASKEYCYDKNGNMWLDRNKKMKTLYNYLNLPSRVSDTITPANKIEYIYTSAGEKLKQRLSTGTTLLYFGNYVYTLDGSANGIAVKYILTQEGRATYSAGAYTYEYFIKDHLGNVRVSFKDSSNVAVIIQKTDYYPFGMMHKPQSLNRSDNRYLYNGKELQDESLGGVNLDFYDYGARMYDPQLGRFHTQDRFAEKYLDFTPYQYGANNPILFIDVNGDSIKYANSAIESYIKQFTSKTITTKQGKVKENRNYHEGFAELIGNLESADEMFVFTNDKSLQTDQSAEGEFTFDGKNFNIIFNDPAEGYGGKSGLLFEETFHAGQFLEGKAWFTKSKKGAWSGNGVDVYDEYYAKSFASTAPGVKLSYERSGLNIQTQLGIVSSLTPHMARRYLIEGTTGFSQGNKIGYPAPYPNLSTANTNSPYKEKRVNGNIYAYPAKN